MVLVCGVKKEYFHSSKQKRSFTPITMLRSIILLLAVFLGCARADCSPAEEGQTTSITCPVYEYHCVRNHRLLLWYSDNSRIAHCYHSSCDSPYDQHFSVDPETKVLTIQNVSRTSPFNMETSWRCESEDPCFEDIACKKLEIFARPEKPGCTAYVDTGADGDDTLTVACWTSKVYPQARCKFELLGQDNVYSSINQTANYNHTKVSENPAYYSSQCSVSVPVAQLGNEPHMFQGYIYPDVANGESLVEVITVVAGRRAGALEMPESPECTAHVDDTPGGNKHVTISCSTSRVYPKTECMFELLENGNFPIRINQTATYNHTRVSEDPVYYSSQCSVSVPVAQLGNEPHMFQAYIYPSVYGGERLVKAISVVATEKLALPTKGDSGNDDSSVNIAAIITGAVAAVIIAGLVVIIVIMRRNQSSTAMMEVQGKTGSVTEDENVYVNTKVISSSNEGNNAPTSSEIYGNVLDTHHSATPRSHGQTSTSNEYNITSAQDVEPANVYIDMSATALPAEKTPTSELQSKASAEERKRGKVPKPGIGVSSNSGRENAGLNLDLDLDRESVEEEIEEEAYELTEFDSPSNIPAAPPIPQRRNKGNAIARLSGKLSNMVKKNMSIFQSDTPPSPTTDGAMSSNVSRQIKKTPKRVVPQPKPDSHVKNQNSSREGDTYRNVEISGPNGSGHVDIQAYYESVEF